MLVLCCFFRGQGLVTFLSKMEMRATCIQYTNALKIKKTISSVDCSFSGKILFINYKTFNLHSQKTWMGYKCVLLFSFQRFMINKNCLLNKHTNFCLIFLHYNINLRLRIVNRIQNGHRLTPLETSWSFIGSFCSCSSLITWSWTLTLPTPLQVC